jgi:hypothetical protein
VPNGGVGVGVGVGVTVTVGVGEGVGPSPKPRIWKTWSGVDCHLGVDVEEGFTIASLIMRNRGLFLAD